MSHNIYYVNSNYTATRKSLKVKIFKIKFIFRRKASPSIDKCGAKPRIFSQNQKQSQNNHATPEGSLSEVELVYLGEANRPGARSYVRSLRLRSV